MATFREIVDQIRVGLERAGDRGDLRFTVKEMLMRAAKEADPPPSKEEFRQAMVELGLRPGWD
jgi:hypothetical protein